MQSDLDLIPLDLFLRFDREEWKDEALLSGIRVPTTPMDLSLCSVEYVRKDDGPVILLFCRAEDGIDYTIPVYNFRPYFYTKKRDAELIRSKYTSQIEIAYPGISGYLSTDTLAKIYTKYPSQVGSFRKISDPNRKGFYIKSWEADILFPLRYLIDMGITTGIHYDPLTGDVTPRDMPSILRKVYVDIEVWAYKNPNMVTCIDPITVIGYYDNIDKEYTILTSKTNISEDDLKSYLVQRDYKFNLIKCVNEKEVLNRFVGYLKMKRPDLFLCFTPFDWLYIINRMRKVGMWTGDLSRVGITQEFGDGGKCKVHGLQYMDIQDMYYQVFLSGSKWETLHAIGTRELQEEKLYKEESVYENWKDKPERVLIRNVRDVEIIRRLDEELHLLSYFDAIKRIIGCNFSDTIYKSRIADIMYLRFCNNKLALPTKTRRKKLEYEGGAVFEVVPGIYKDIVIFDWSSMYPSIIKAFNMSFETFISKPDKDTFNIDDKFFFRKEPVGWTVQLIDILNPIRTPYKKRSKDKTLSKEERNYNKAVSEGVKSVVNSIYGVFGQSGNEAAQSKAYRLYLPYLAAATTYVGRILQIEGLTPICEEIGYDVIYADTDSIFLQLKTDNHEQEIKEIEAVLSDRMNKFIQDRWGANPTLLELSFETHFETFMIFSKKRYIGRTVEGNVVTKGLEIVRRNTAEISSEVQLAVSNAVFDGKTKKEITAIIRGYVDKFSTLPLEDIAVAQNVKKPIEEYKTTSGHLKAYQFSTKVLHMSIPINKRFWTCYIKNAEIPEKYSDAVFKEVKDEDTRKKKLVLKYRINQVAWDESNDLPDDIRAIVDYPLMLEKTIKDKIKLFMELLDIDWYKDVLGIEKPKKGKRKKRE